MKIIQKECAPHALSTMPEEDASALATQLKAMADPLRLRMLSALALDPRGEACVCDLEQLAAVSQPTISHHLRVLKAAGLVASERRGTWVYYRLTPDISPALRALFTVATPEHAA